MNQGKRKSAIKDWGKLFIGLLFILLFVFGIAPALENLPYIEEVHTYSKEHNINASALIYSDIEQFGDADVLIRNAIHY